jgi:hypothetical protein
MVQGLYYIKDYQTTKTNRVIAEYHSALVNPKPEFYSIYINFFRILFGDYGMAYDLLAPCCMGFPYFFGKDTGEVEIVQIWK